MAATEAAEAERVYRQEALAHARAIAEAWRRLEDHILRRSTAATRWTGSVPPAATGWLDAWTGRGVRARYCEDTLLVYMEPAALKGVGRDQRAVQVAPHLYAGGELAALHWLEGGAASGAASGTATGTAGRASVVLPSCLSDPWFGGPLPSGRVALAGVVRDPHVRLSERVSHERTAEDCPAGSHGDGLTMTREVIQAHDGRGDAVGDPEFGPWQVLIDDCRADYSEWEHYTLPCEWDAGPPHNRRMEGRRGLAAREGGDRRGHRLGHAGVRFDELLGGAHAVAARGRDIGDGAHRDHAGGLRGGLHGHGGADAGP